MPASRLASLCLANRLAGNPEGAACLELTFGGVALRSDSGGVDRGDRRAAADVTGRHERALSRPRRSRRVRHPPAAGVRTYVAVRGGLDVPTPWAAGPRTLPVRPRTRARWAAGDRLPVGRASGVINPVDVAPGAPAPERDPVLRITARPARRVVRETLAPLRSARGTR